MDVLDDLKGKESVSGCVLKFGEVTAIDAKAGKIRVTFDDEDSMTTDWLQVIQRNTMQNKDFAMPDLNEDVVVLFTGESAETGVVLGSWYADEITAPESTVDVRSVTFGDGAKISYNRSSSVLTISINGTTVTIDKNNVQVSAAQNVDVTGSSVVNVNGGAAVNITAPSVTLTMGSTTMTLTGSKATIKSDDLTFEGSKMTVTGDLEVQGNIDSSGNITAQGTISGSNI